MATKKSRAGAKKKPARKPAPKPKSVKRVVTPEVVDSAPVLPFEIDPRKVEESLQKLKSQVVTLAKKGRYTKVRFKFRGKQLLPDIPLAAVVAVEGATFYWAGALRALLFTVAGRALVEVELVNDSEKQLAAGKAALLSGELEEALVHFHTALDMDHENPAVHLNLGIAFKLKGAPADARAALEKCLSLAPKGPHAAEAERLLKSLTSAMVVAS